MKECPRLCDDVKLSLLYLASIKMTTSDDFQIFPIKVRLNDIQSGSLANLVLNLIFIRGFCARLIIAPRRRPVWKTYKHVKMIFMFRNDFQVAK